MLELGFQEALCPLRIVLFLGSQKLTNIISIDQNARTAVVQPGVRNLAISEAAEEYGLYYAPDPSSQIACTIGGNVAENAGGVHCLKYGLTVQNIESLKILTIDGDELVFSRQDDGLGLFGTHDRIRGAFRCYYRNNS